MTDRDTAVAGWGPDIRVAAAAATGLFLCGVLPLIGLLWIGGFGVVLGLAGSVGWVFWWRKRNDGSIFPGDVDGVAFAVTIGISVLGLFLVLA